VLAKGSAVRARNQQIKSLKRFAQGLAQRSRVAIGAPAGEARRDDSCDLIGAAPPSRLRYYITTANRR